MHNNRITLMALAISIFVFANPAMAYVGPGAGLSAIGSVLAFLGVVLLMILGFVWYPIKRVINRVRKKPEVDDEDDTLDSQ